jgi:3-hydroxyacyl-CoA dehydrogenase
MVIEAVPEVLEMKIEDLAAIDVLAPQDCVVASNSSSLRTSHMVIKRRLSGRFCLFSLKV